MLVQRWRILQAALPKGISILKSIALVNCLTKLHNYCIDQTEVLAIDRAAFTNAAGGFITLDEVENADGPVPVQLLGGGGTF